MKNRRSVIVFLVLLISLCSISIVSCGANDYGQMTPTSTSELNLGSTDGILQTLIAPQPPALIQDLVSVEQALIEEGVEQSDIRLEEIPMCQASLDVIESLDLSEFGVDPKCEKRLDYIKQSNRIFIYERQDEGSRLTIIEKVNDQWVKLYSRELLVEYYYFKASPSGRYIILETILASGGKFAIFDVDRGSVVGEATTDVGYRNFQWSDDESRIILPLRCGSLFTPACDEIVDVYSVPDLKLIRTIPWPQDENYWLQHGLWWNPDRIDPEEFVFRAINGMYYYHDEVIDVVEGLSVQNYYFGITIAWIDNDTYLASYREMVEAPEDSTKNYIYSLLKFGLFKKNELLAEYAIFDKSADYYFSIVEYNPSLGRAINTIGLKDWMFNFNINDFSIENVCRQSISQLIDPSRNLPVRELYKGTYGFISDNEMYYLKDNLITFYYINWSNNSVEILSP